MMDPMEAERPVLRVLNLTGTGCTVTWLMVDGKYVVTAVDSDRDRCHVGIGNTPTEAAEWLLRTSEERQ